MEPMTLALSALSAPGAQASLAQLATSLPDLAKIGMVEGGKIWLSLAEASPLLVVSKAIGKRIEKGGPDEGTSFWIWGAAAVGVAAVVGVGGFVVYKTSKTAEAIDDSVARTVGAIGAVTDAVSAPARAVNQARKEAERRSRDIERAATDLIKDAQDSLNEAVSSTASFLGMRI